MAPTSIEMIGRSSGDLVSVNENEEVELKCKVSDGKPKAAILWFKGNVRFVVGESSCVSLS